MTTITPEQFMTLTQPDEEELVAPAVVPYDPNQLDLIAESLWRIEARLAGSDQDEGLADSIRQELLDLEAKHAELYALLEEIEAILKPSTSKLANSVRDAITRWRAPEVPAEPVPVSNAVEMGAPPPAHDATVEEWRLYANTLGYIEPQVDVMNRSQIRTLLGIEQPAEVTV